MKSKKGKGKNRAFSPDVIPLIYSSSHLSGGARVGTLVRPSSRALEAPKSKEARRREARKNKGRIFDVKDDAADERICSCCCCRCSAALALALFSISATVDSKLKSGLRCQRE